MLLEYPAVFRDFPKEASRPTVVFENKIQIKIITSNYHSFGCPIIYRDTIDYANLFIDTSNNA